MTANSQLPRVKVVYLHGFASSPGSSKAVFFARKLRELGINITIPDLNQPSFQNMTLTSQLQVVDETLQAIAKNKPVVLFGSSMGGLLATITASKTSRTAGLVLFAPGFGLASRWPTLFGEEKLGAWKDKGSIDVYNYAAGKDVPLSYEFFQDVSNHETEELFVKVPTLIFHGRFDEVVPISASEEFARRNPGYVMLHQVDDDHQLLASLEYIWQRTEQFLSPPERNASAR